MIPACPYYERLATPVIKFCEPNLCAPIVQPANAWSNLAFIVVGVIILTLARHHKKNLLWWLGPIALIIGTVSFFYHASYTAIGQMLDLGSMFLFSTLLLVLNLKRIKPGLKNSTTAWIYVIINALCLLTMYFIHRAYGYNVGILIFGILLAAVFALESIAWSRTLTRYRLRHILAAVLLASIAAVIWMFDYTRIWCDSNTLHYLNGHAVWHILTATSLLFIFFFYRQFISNQHD